MDYWYYLGWVIQLSPLGFFVYDRQDHSEPSTTNFGSLRRAMDYIESQVKHT